MFDHKIMITQNYLLHASCLYLTLLKVPFIFIPMFTIYVSHFDPIGLDLDQCNII